MSGHSKWSTIKRQKGTQDAKRGQIFTKLSNAITIAVKQNAGITDPESNFKLRLAIDKARSANMPKENIERAMQKAKGSGAGNVEELLYEGFAPGGIALLIEAVTDNKQRTVSEVKNVLEKNGGTLGSQGSVSYLFNKRGEIIIEKNRLTSEELLNRGIELGVEDIEEEGNLAFFYVDPNSLMRTKKDLEGQAIMVGSAELVYLPSNYIKPDPESQRKAANLIEKLEEMDDVQKVYSNLDIS